MENVSPIIDTVKLVGPTIWKYVKFQTIPNSYVKEWDSQIKSLQRRVHDVGAELQSQLMGVGKIPKQEVEDWRDKAKKATEANADLSTKCGCFSNICRSKHFDEMAQELKRMFDEGEKYIHGGEVLVMDDPSKVKDHFMGEFQQLCRSLGDRQKDIQSTLNQQLHFGKIAKDEVKNWLKEVEEKLKTSRVEVSEGGCLSPSDFAKLLQERNGELKKLLDEGEKYTGAGAVLVKDDPLMIRGVPLGDEKCYGRDDALVEIPKHLKGDQVARIAVWGMGGIGKTTLMKQIHNQFLQESKFDKIIWVTVSSELNTFRIQDDIAKQITKKPLEAEDATKRAGMISTMLSSGNCLMILDDVWGNFSAEKVGIPAANSGDKCLKLVLTTRTAAVARQTDCDLIIKLEPLSPDESLRLFLDKVGGTVLSNDGKIKPDLESTLKQIVEECDGLPLAIVTVARRMKREPDHQYSWLKALKQLRNGKIDVAGEKDPIMVTLKFSYDGLEDKKLQDCFLYCALYPEDFEIPKKQLISYWIQEGFFDQIETRHEMICEGHEILRKLQDNCMLEFSSKNCMLEHAEIDDEYAQEVGKILGANEHRESVKMHDLLRDMALDITSNSPRFFVKTGMSVEELLREKPWTTDVEKVSLMRNYGFMEEIPTATTHLKYDMLTTLLMPHNDVSTIPESFFMQTPGLKILDLSWNKSLRNLPGSLSHLENLTTLILKHCWSLKEVPSLSKCLALTKLVLHDTGIVEVPDGAEMLINLMHLSLKGTMIETLPEGMLSKLSNLQYLSAGTTRIRAEEVVKLRKLERLKAYLKGNLDEISILLGFMKNQVKWLRSNTLQVKAPSLKLYLYGNQNGMFSILLNGKPIFELHYTNVDLGWVNSILVNHDLSLRCLFIEDMEKIECVFGSSFNPLQTLEALYLDELENLKSVFDDKALGLSAPPSSSNSSYPLKVIAIKKCPALKNLVSPALLLCYLQNLEFISIEDCENMEEIISFTSEEEEVLQKLTLPKLKKLKLRYLPALKSICNRRSSVLICDSLEVLKIELCHELKRMSLYLPQLEYLSIADCENMEEIISFTSEEEGALQKLTLPKLEKLTLWHLPALKSICNRRSSVLICDSLEVLEIIVCKELKRMSLYLPQLDDAQPSPSPLKEIRTLQDEWESWEWPQHNAKCVLLPKCDFLR